MLALQKVGATKTGLVLHDVPEPGCGLRDLVVEVMCVGICGSDLHIWRDEKEYCAPVTLGHEFAGRVIATGCECRRVRVGDRVCCDIETPIGRIGTHVNGAFAKRVALPEVLAHKLPDAISYEDGAMVEMVACMAHALMHRSRINPADFVAVLGPGPIGLVLMQLVRLWSPRFVMVTGLKSDGRRLDMARELGADLTWNADEDPVAKVLDMTGGQGADLVLDASGGEGAITQAAQMVRMGGWVTVVGLWGRPINVNLDMVPYRCLALRGSWGWAGMESGDQAVKVASGFESWETALRVMALGKLNMTRMITRRIVLEEWEGAFRDLEAQREIKVMVYPNPDLYPPEARLSGRYLVPTKG